MAEDASIPADIAQLSFEDAMTALENIVRQLEGGKVKLDEAVDAYERGVALRKHCEAKLNEARQRVEKITLSSDGRLTGAAPLDAG